MTSSGIRFSQIQSPSHPVSGNVLHYSGQAILSDLTGGFHNITVYYGGFTSNASSPSDENIA